MSVLAEQPPPGEASFDFAQKGAARRKWVRRRKGISKARAPTVSHISPGNVLPREAAGTSPLFQRLRKRPTSCQNTSQKGCGHPRRRPGQICCNHFSSQISIVLESIFIWYLQTQRGKKKQKLRKNTYTHSWLLGILVQFVGSTKHPKYLPCPKISLTPCGQFVILNPAIFFFLKQCLVFRNLGCGQVGPLIPCSL